MNDRLSRPGWKVAVALLLAIGLPLVLDDAHRSTYVLCALSVIVVCGLSLLMGHAGQASFGQAAYYAIGAYAAALSSIAGLPTILALLLGPVTSALVAWAIGGILLRLRGFYLSFATIALQLMLLALLGPTTTTTPAPDSLRRLIIKDAGRVHFLRTAEIDWEAAKPARRNAPPAELGQPVQGEIEQAVGRGRVEVPAHLRIRFKQSLGNHEGLAFRKKRESGAVGHRPSLAIASGGP